jgi:hypothetical protein
MEYDKIGAAHGNARTLGEKAEIIGDARIDAAQSFADARIDAAKRGLAQANSQAGGIVRQGFMDAGVSALSGAVSGGMFNSTPRPDMNTPIPGVSDSGFGGSGSLTGARGDTFGSFGTFNNNNDTIQFGGYGSSGIA